MELERLAIPDVCLLSPQVFGDERGFFLESWNKYTFKNLGLDIDFVQDNHSCSRQGVLRGLHYQIEHPQGKLVRVVEGEVFDVAVDLRRSSPTFARWVGVNLSANNHQMLWIPPGFAHGFYVLSSVAQVLYKATDYYVPTAERYLSWKDSTLNINWPIIPNTSPILANKDALGLSLLDCDLFP